MLKTKYFFGYIINLSLLFFLLGNPQNAMAKMPETEVEIPSQFTKIEQPLPLKIGITLGGIGLISLELWWFLFSKTKAQQAEKDYEVQE